MIADLFRRRRRPYPTLEDRAVGAFLGVAVGDALGATLEFMTPSEIERIHGTHRDIKGGGWLHLKRGAVTDDTEMSLALGDAIVTAGGIDTEAIAQAFDAWMRSKPADIGQTVRRGIVRFRRHGTLEAKEDDYAAGNGACMRTLPIALAMLGRDWETVREASRAQAHITHNNALSDAGTECVIRMVQYLMIGAGGRDGLVQLADALVAEHPRFRFDRKRNDNPSAYIVDTLRVVFQGLFAHETFEHTLIDVINRGGDSDTTGAIAGMIAGALYGPRAIPRRWLIRLDKTVRRACEDQARALLRLSGVENAANDAAPAILRDGPSALLRMRKPVDVCQTVAIPANAP